MAGEISQLGRSQRAIRIAHRLQRMGAKLVSDLLFCFLGFEPLKSLDQLLNLFARRAAHSGFSFHNIPPKTLALHHVVRGNEQDRRHVE